MTDKNLAIRTLEHELDRVLAGKKSAAAQMDLAKQTIDMHDAQEAELRKAIAAIERDEDQADTPQPPQPKFQVGDDVVVRTEGVFGAFGMPIFTKVGKILFDGSDYYYDLGVPGIWKEDAVTKPVFTLPKDMQPAKTRAVETPDGKSRWPFSEGTIPEPEGDERDFTAGNEDDLPDDELDDEF